MSSSSAVVVTSGHTGSGGGSTQGVTSLHTGGVTGADVVVDALPYFDLGYDEPGVRDAALALVEEETRRYRPTKNYLDYLQQPNYNAFETPVMKAECDRLSARQPMEMLNMKRYELPQPPSGKVTDLSAWVECVDNSRAQLEHQATRICNLELMNKYGSNAWRSYNELLVKMVEEQQGKLHHLRKEIQEVNWERKHQQTQTGDRLKELEAAWVGLVSKNYEIERACAHIQLEIEEREREVRRVRRVQADEDDFLHSIL